MDSPHPSSPSRGARWSTRLLSIIMACIFVMAVLQYLISPVGLVLGTDTKVGNGRGLLAALSRTPPELSAQGAEGRSRVIVAGRGTPLTAEGFDTSKRGTHKGKSKFVSSGKDPVSSGINRPSRVQPGPSAPKFVASSREVPFPSEGLEGNGVGVHESGAKTGNGKNSAITPRPEISSDEAQQNSSLGTQGRQLRILHVVTSSYIHRMGRDRLRGTVLPTLASSVRSIVKSGRYSVDVHLILGYVLEPADRDTIVSTLHDVHPGVGLSIWDDATPRLDGREYPKALAMRHREVVKGVLFNNSLAYDIFSCWEDDMLIGARQVDRYLRLSGEIEALAQSTPEGDGGSYGDDIDTPLSREQLQRMIPGFIRVEVVDVDRNHAAGKTDLECCGGGATEERRLLVWETRPEGFRVRRVPSLGTLGLLPVSNEPNRRAIGAIRVDPSASSNDAELFGQQAGWMATREQVLRFERERCVKHGFLPPFRGQAASALQKQTVEYWSGGFNLFGWKSGCAMQRVMQLDSPEQWEEGLLWHTSNNKQRVRKVDNQRYWDAELLRKEILHRWGNLTGGRTLYGISQEKL